MITMKVLKFHTHSKNLMKEIGLKRIKNKLCNFYSDENLIKFHEGCQK